MVQLKSRLQNRFGSTLAIILLIFTLVPVVALLLLSAYTIRVHLENRSLASLGTLANLIDTEITQWAETSRGRLATALNDPVIAQNTSFALQSSETFGASRSALVLAGSLTSLVEDNRFDNIYLTRVNGEVVVGTSGNADLAALEVDFGAAGQSSAYRGFERRAATGDWAMLTWQPVLDRQQVTIGYLVGEMSLDGLARLLKDKTVGSGQAVAGYLLSPDGVVLTHTETADGTRYQVVEGDTVVPDPATGDSAGGYSGLFRSYDDVPAIGTITPLTLPLGLHLVVYQSEADAFQLLYDALPVAVVFTLGLTALAIIASVSTTQRIVTPLRSLEQAAQAMSAGELKARVESTRRDEFGSLANSFNTMAGELEQTFAELARSNDLLASRADQLATITRVGQTANQFLDLESLLETVVKQLQAAFSYQAVAIYLPSEDQSLLEARAVAAPGQNIVLSDLRRPIDNTSAVGAAAMTQEVTQVTARGENVYPLHALQAGASAEANIPLIVGSPNLLIGVLSIQSSEASVFSTADLEVLQILGNQIAIAIRNADLYAVSELARQIADDANRQKSDFLSNMSHELRTPLNVVIGYSHSILNRPAMYNHEPLPAVYMDAIDSIMTSGQHLLGLINDILDLSKIEAGKIDLSIKPMDPLPVLHGVRATGLGLIKDEVEIIASYRDDLPYIMGDEVRIRQILLNLVSNAAKFTDRGFITLDAQVVDNQLVFSVVDTGHGIPDEVQPNLFTRFKQGVSDQAAIHGTGLGLSICRELTLMHGGEIGFTSKAGQGSTFHFSIPLATPEVTEEMRLKALLGTGAAGRREESLRVSIFETQPEPAALVRQVLLLDFDTATRGEIQNALTEAGYNVMAVHEIDRGIALATALFPDLILVASHSMTENEVSAFCDAIRREESLRDTALLVLRDIDLPQHEGDSWQNIVEIVVNTLPSRDPVE